MMDNAIVFLNKSQATLGAALNRTFAAVSNLSNINTNSSAARLRILNADYAVENYLCKLIWKEPRWHTIKIENKTSLHVK